jgi:hypothetical protein
MGYDKYIDFVFIWVKTPHIRFVVGLVGGSLREIKHDVKPHVNVWLNSY